MGEGGAGRPGDLVSPEAGQSGDTGLCLTLKLLTRVDSTAERSWNRREGLEESAGISGLTGCCRTTYRNAWGMGKREAGFAGS